MHEEAEHYPFREVETKWRNYWQENGLHEPDLDNPDDKLYTLVMFSYPSGDKLHCGHWYNFGPTDTWARFQRMNGKNVFEPMGFDAFGLPAENYAIKHGIHPDKSTQANIDYMRKQLRQIGAMYDWRNEVDTSDPDYYKWTQWIFLKLYEEGLAYKENAPVNWCPSCETVLANEQVIEGKCERCDSEVEKKKLEQWFFKITDYAEELLEGLERIDWPEKTKAMQRHWIGKSVGAEMMFPLAEQDEEEIKVFTTRPDTIYGATYMVLAPEHPLVEEITTEQQRIEVEEYVAKALRASDIDRLAEDREKTGVFTGAYAINPFTKARIPIWIADYVLYTYGTGAIMAVPAHDERDYEFARKYDLSIEEVISPDGDSHGTDTSYTEYGVLINSEEYSGLSSEKAIKKIAGDCEERGIGKASVQYRLRDWLISRQRYWGAPIPVVYCDDCGTVPVPVDDLPVELPRDLDLRDTQGSGIAPLGHSDEFLNTSCPECGSEATREIDTMDTFVDSSWYFLRYVDARYEDGPWNPERVKEWLPVDQYVGGAEHATMHLLYARFVIKALHDAGLLDFDEPFQRLLHQGTITKDGSKMSKSRGNTVSPDEFIDDYGSDIFRMYLMFMGPYEDGGDWSDKGIVGIDRFVNRMWRLVNSHADTDIMECSDDELLRIMHNTIKSVLEDTADFKFNTALSRIMEYVNAMYKTGADIARENLDVLVRLIAPFAPHLGEELWVRLGNEPSIFETAMPEYREDLLQDETVEIVIQVNGKVRDSFHAPADASKKALKEQAIGREKVQKYTEGKEIGKTIVIPNRLVNIVVK
ncbi:MAG: leucine--tRNA ligase [Candidatus Marinimicrobia bacterium]|nr:leucine--tRNA ligase [Candidatus Neomarinimicrobiota bacterium]MCF7828334.1 leucine--tRNA ligase [Candidatus Neomarinimicrobiota bacterium]MCF7879491.1 leucine--tRNA ligase [Candidatus Neomarinimicrobiota bacterium]